MTATELLVLFLTHIDGSFMVFSYFLFDMKCLYRDDLIEEQLYRESHRCGTN